MNPGFKQTLDQECRFCGAVGLDDADRIELAIETGLFGADVLALCPSCGRRMEPEERTAAWRRRVRRWLKDRGRLSRPKGGDVGSQQ